MTSSSTICPSRQEGEARGPRDRRGLLARPLCLLLVQVQINQHIVLLRSNLRLRKGADGEEWQTRPQATPSSTTATLYPTTPSGRRRCSKSESAAGTQTPQPQTGASSGKGQGGWWGQILRQMRVRMTGGSTTVHICRATCILAGRIPPSLWRPPPPPNQEGTLVSRRFQLATLLASAHRQSPSPFVNIG